MTRHYCTYFDHRYLSRGLVLHDSLRRHGGAQLLWVLCLSEECERALRRLARPGLQIVTLAQLEDFDPALAACKATRSAVEYYFTCSPVLPRYVLAGAPEADAVTYVDADLCFFADPELLFAEVRDCSTAITPHRFTPAAQRSHGKYGAFNVGLVYFRRDEAGTACLQWWRDRCIEWCYDRLEGDRYADQKYLERFAALFPGVCSLQHPGANLAPWNIGGHRVGGDVAAPTVDGRPVLFFHFQGLRPIAPGRYDSNLGSYGARLDDAARDNLFVPYLRQLEAVEASLLRDGLIARVEPGARRAASGLKGQWRRAKLHARQALARLQGNIVELRPGA
jgi:hypothetical protein